MKNLIQLDPVGPRTFRVFHINRPSATLGHVYMEADGLHVFDYFSGADALPAYVLRAIADEMDALDAGWLAQLNAPIGPLPTATAHAA